MPKKVVSVKGSINVEVMYCIETDLLHLVSSIAFLLSSLLIAFRVPEY